jgi:hypothetical protein
MKPFRAIAFLTVASILGIGSSLAQVQSRQVRATVPFDFAVGNNQLPAGVYSIDRAANGTILIQNQKTHVLVMTLASENGSPSAGCMLEFDEHASQNFLHSVLCQSASISINLPASSLEKRALVEEAKLHNSGVHILIAAR